MKKIKISIVQAGISGYGYYYLKTLLDECEKGTVSLQGVVEPAPDNSELTAEIKRREVPVLKTLDEFYTAGLSADLALIVSPPHYHVSQIMTALCNGSNVLCDKPLGVTVQEVDALIIKKNRVKTKVMVGYQWSYSSAIHALKKDVIRGIFGRPLQLKTLCFWPRDKAYYQRNDWAGRIKDDFGNWVLDSPANNAMAHFLHNILYILGEKSDTSVNPVRIQAELYRVFPIENYDSIACRIFTSSGAELLFYASHAVPKDLGPMFAFKFEEANITYGEKYNDIIGQNRKGKVNNYGSPEASFHFKKLFDSIEVAKGNKQVICGPEAARAQTLCINGIQDSLDKPVTIPASLVQQDKKTGRIWSKNLADTFYNCYLKGLLPSETGIDWADCGRTVDLRDYKYFPQGRPQKEKRKCSK